MKSKLALIILAYWRSLARLQLRKNPRAVIIGITGSAGKTSARRAISLILAQKGRVKQSAHANSESGIPLNILGLTPHSYTAWDWLRLIVLAPLMLIINWEKYAYYVVEMGIDSPEPPKNMDYLLGLIQPHVAVVLNAGLVHSAAFDHLVRDVQPARRQAKLQSTIAAEKFKLARAVGPTGVVVVNHDQAEFRSQLPQLKARVLTFGSHRLASFHLHRIQLVAAGLKVQFTYQNRTFKLEIPEPLDLANAHTLLASIAAASAVGIPLPTSVAALRHFRAPRGRLRHLLGLGGTHLLDSSYNASPATMANALSTLASLAGKSPRLAVLGDLRELGKSAKLAHQQLAGLIRESCDECFLFGPLTAKYTLPILKTAGFPVRHFDRMSALIRELRQRPAPGSWILVKGSQNELFLERAVEAMLADKSDAAQLCRRGKYWDQRRAATP